MGEFVRRWGLALSFATALSVAVSTARADKPDAKPSDLPKVASGATEHMVAMSDGVKLATNVYLPKGDGPFPVILTRTPYGKDSGMAVLGERYVKAGYVYILQDCRGRFRSEGTYTVFETDRDDGFDTVDWVAHQPWCNGKVGMSGASAMGITSLLAAIAQPPALKCAFVIVAPQSFATEAIFIGGVFKEADTTGWLNSQKVPEQIPLRRVALNDTKLEDEQDIAPHRPKIQIPIYHVGGWYDIFSVGTQGNFAFLQNQGAAGARGTQKLLMGPFGHGQLKGELKYPDGGGMLSAMEEEMKWFDHHLKGIANEIATEPPVKYYQMASARKRQATPKNGWKTAANWPPESHETRYFLQPDRTLATAAPEASDASTAYAFDPAKPVPTVGGANLTLPIGPMDQREVGERDDYLRFQTPVLEQDVTIAGRVYLDLYAATDGTDTDFCIKLVDVYPDGYEALILDQPLRTRYRHGHRPNQVELMEPNRPERMSIELGSTANTFEAGHRIAVHVTSSNAPRFDVNPNTGEQPGSNKLPPRVARNTVFHDSARPTALVLPVTD
ncbi:MAG: CocE/NonD family hydrolase [Pirellulales bacterium]|nr:CocE/NonD family hydrolase [Pirellulales bacterium]